MVKPSAEAIIAQAKDGEFTSDDDDHHPGGNQVHVYERNEGGEIRSLSRWIKKNAERGDLQRRRAK